jgi:hypothetical protein
MFNVFVPGLVGGDALRAIYLGPRHQRLDEAVASVVADRGFRIVGFFWLAAAAAAELSAAVLPSVRGPTIAVGLIALAGYIALPLLGNPAQRMPERIGVVRETVEPYLSRSLASGWAVVSSAILARALPMGCSRADWVSTDRLPCSCCVSRSLTYSRPAVDVQWSGPARNRPSDAVRERGLGPSDAIALGLLSFAATALGNLTGLIAFVLTDTPRKSSPRTANHMPSYSALRLGFGR